MSGWGGDVEQEFRRTPFIDGEVADSPVWENAPGSLVGMRGGAPGIAGAFDGTNWVFVSCQASSGIWRYIEPTPTTVVTPPVAATASGLRAKVSAVGKDVVVTVPAGTSWQLELFTPSGALLARHGGTGSARIGNADTGAGCAISRMRTPSRTATTTVNRH
jgi:hypothetical protein